MLDDLILRTTEDGLKLFWCPGCQCAHFIDPKKWTITGAEDKPTVSPSILVRYVWHPYSPETDADGKYILGSDGRLKGAKDMCCHSFIRNGQIQYLGDCTHPLAGKTIDMEAF